MKAKLLQSTVLWTFLSAATLFVGCSDDEDYRDVDGQSPTLELTSDHIRTLTGYEFKIAGKIADKDGIRSINLQSFTWTRQLNCRLFIQNHCMSII